MTLKSVTCCCNIKLSEAIKPFTALKGRVLLQQQQQYIWIRIKQLCE